jgi:hypothetical protein
MLEHLKMLHVPQSENRDAEAISREVQWAWLAGIIDGEGNLNIQVRPGYNGKNYFRPKIRVANTDVRMIARISELYVAENIVFFYNINDHHVRKNPTWKCQINIEVASQGSGAKVLKRIIPHLVNKRRSAEIMLELITFVQKMPKGGNTLAYDYVNEPEFVRLRAEFEKEAKWYLDPSTITRRAREILSW